MLKLINNIKKQQQILENAQIEIDRGIKDLQKEVTKRLRELWNKTFKVKALTFSPLGDLMFRGGSHTNQWVPDVLIEIRYKKELVWIEGPYWKKLVYSDVNFQCFKLRADVPINVKDFRRFLKNAEKALGMPISLVQRDYLDER